MITNVKKLNAKMASLTMVINVKNAKKPAKLAKKKILSAQAANLDGN